MSFVSFALAVIFIIKHHMFMKKAASAKISFLIAKNTV